MNKKQLISAALLAVCGHAFAGGLLTNTNQNVWFLRNMAREGAIGIDGVYSNPAGVVFLGRGFHLSLNYQAAFQKRIVDTTNPYFPLGAQNGGNTTKHFEGSATAPFVPSIQAAYNTDKWSFQFNFAVVGGGGKCEFAEGLGSFESAVANVANTLKASTEAIKAGGIPVDPVTGYDMKSYLKGNQYYFGVTLGAARKLNEHWSVYGGLRVLIGSASYRANINDINVVTAAGAKQDLTTYFGGLNQVVKGTAAQIQNGINQYVDAYMAHGMTKEQAMAMPEVQALVAKGQAVQGVATELEKSAQTMGQYANGVNLEADQSGIGIAPIIGVDFKTRNFNFGVKYEFRTRMRLKNKSNVKEASMIEAVNKFRDGTKVPEDSPALLAFGAQWEFLRGARLSAAYHHFFDKQSAKYGDAQKLLSGGTNEYIVGLEVDITKKLQASGGLQFTRNGLTDKFMNDISFTTNSWSFGLGVGYRISDNVMVNAAYFQSNYAHYKAADATGANDFTRTNRVIGVGVDLTF